MEKRRMHFKSLEPYYQNFKIFREENIPDEINVTIDTARWINLLSGRTVFDEAAMKKLAGTPVNQQIEDYYMFMLNDLIRRNEIFQTLSDKYHLHVLVSDFLEISTNVVGKDAVIVMEWPYIKYIDMFNKEIFYAETSEFAERTDLLFRSFAEKYIQKVKTEKTFHFRRGDNQVFFRLRTYIRNLQELFMQGHELAHLLLRNTDYNTEEEADKLSFYALLGYCRHEQSIMHFILCAVMLLFSYMTWLDAIRKSEHGGQAAAIKLWQRRYDRLFDIMEPYYKSMDKKEQEFVNSYDRLCGELDQIGAEFLENFQRNTCLKGSDHR